MTANRGSDSELHGLFVAGTDTGVGKTVVACALLRVARDRGRPLIPFKPVETGADPEPQDARLLHASALPPVSPEMVCLYPLALPAAPQAAASRAGATISLDAILERARYLASLGDGLLVEPAGGLLVPYAPGLTGADLAEHLGFPVLLVARSSLGTINHTALSIAELRRRRLDLAGLILVQTQAERQPHEETNAALIEQLTAVRALGTFPHLEPEAATAPEQLALALVQCLHPPALDALLAAATAPPRR